MESSRQLHLQHVPHSAQGPPSEARKIPVDILVHQRVLPQKSTEDYFCRYHKNFEFIKLTGPVSSCELATENAYISCSFGRGCVFRMPA